MVQVNKHNQNVFLFYNLLILLIFVFINHNKNFVGVVGKALIEKLLRSCNVKKIYVLLRDKKNVPIEERLEKIKQEMVRNTLLHRNI